MKKLSIVIILAGAFAATPNSYALGGVSRACQFSTIPSELKFPAALFFTSLGAPASTLNLVTASIEEQKNWFVLEAITTDYIEARYYLYANAQVYSFIPISENPFIPNNSWVIWKIYSSAGWGANRISREMKSDSAFSIFYQNRGAFYSNRAGASQIIERVPRAPGVLLGVIGAHTYYDPVSKRTFALGDTSAVDCNLTNWGVEKNGMFDW